ncbi:MAG: hypothetical protein A2X31_09740 [Elusimicrobia bacterium GWB2_63_22]|nr:MAG: hypothetical protein A2X31_09740 [Elusimicrobia bacterium GWB2_63_22]HBT82280.1 hypothetical protein [Desulfuromonas sp.]
MKTACLSALLAGAALISAAAAYAQTEIVGVDWELSRLNGKTRAPFARVSELRASPDVNFQDRLRAIVTLRNPAAKAVEGVVLRYAVSLRLLRKGDAPEKAFWGVPFYVEEVRVTKINPSAEKQARVIHFELQTQLRKLRSSGFTPLALKMEVMVGPRQGDEPAQIMREAVIEIKP